MEINSSSFLFILLSCMLFIILMHSFQISKIIKFLKLFSDMQTDYLNKLSKNFEEKDKTYQKVIEEFPQLYKELEKLYNEKFKILEKRLTSLELKGE